MDMDLNINLQGEIVETKVSNDNHFMVSPYIVLYLADDLSFISITWACPFFIDR